MENFNLKTFLAEGKLLKEEQGNIIFPISTIEDLDKFYDQDYLKITGEKNKYPISTVASGENAEDMHDQSYAQAIIKTMKKGKFIDAETTSELISDIAAKYFG
jgi:hypothetical protein